MLQKLNTIQIILYWDNIGLLKDMNQDDTRLSIKQNMSFILVRKKVPTSILYSYVRDSFILLFLHTNKVYYVPSLTLF